MNKKLREAIARNIIAIVEKHGGNGVAEHDAKGSTRVDIVMPGVKAILWLSALHRGGVLAHWHGAERRLSRAAFDHVNAYHGRKATTLRRNKDLFLTELDRTCAMIVDGSAFEEG